MKSVLIVSSIAAVFCLVAAAATQPDALDGLAFWVRADTGVRADSAQSSGIMSAGEHPSAKSTLFREIRCRVLRGATQMPSSSMCLT